ncbi:MAG: transaldolase [Chloroflexi bacterium]|nr:transaldolase [Chloroflexota bacterium]
MSLFLDSADPAEVQRAADAGLVRGVTTNPTLIAKVLRKTGPYQEPLPLVQELLRIFPGTVCYQVTATEPQAMLAEARQVVELSPAQVVIQIPATLANLEWVSRYSHEMACAVTAVYSPTQAFLAAEAGARFAIPYVNRATRLLGDGPELVRQIVELLETSTWDCSILATNLKSTAEVVETLLAGAAHVSATWSVIADMAEHPLTQQAIAEFAARS